MHIRHAVAGVALAICLVSPTQLLAAATPNATLTQRHKFDIHVQPLSSALRELSVQSGVRILFPYDEVAAIRSRRIQGWLSTQDALARLLAGTDLTSSPAGEGVIALAAPANRSAARRSPLALQYAQASLPGAGTQAMAMAPAPEPAEDATPIIVTGTRTTNRTVAESLAPIDVLGEKDLESSGKQSVRDLLGTLVPSINVSNNGAGASWAVRTLSLRGLGGDQLLVLVNGKRRHNSATLFINGSVQNGQSPPDLDLIPGNAIQRIEVLRDGASAQYGSDAIAGVVNVILKNDTAGGAALTLGSTADNGGEQGRWQIDNGFSIGPDGGYIHLAADGVLQAGTLVKGSAIGGTYYPTGDPRNANPDLDRYRGKAGQPEVIGGNVSYDAMLPVGDSLEGYSFGTYSKRHAAGWLTYRTPAALNNIIEIYPEGYIPRIHVYDEDFQYALGLRGKIGGGVHFDISSTYSQDEVKYKQTTSLNPSMGTASPTTFYLGKIRFDEWTNNLDLSKEFDVGLAGPLSLAVGAEYKKNKFMIGAGDPESYINGNYVSPPGSWLAGQQRTGVGAQGVTGFVPEGAGSWSRSNWSAYANVEGKIVEGLEFGLAGRHEDYTDFGTTNTGKASLRIEPMRGFAIRGTASTGFRAPTLQQQHYASSSTIGVIQNGVSVLLPVQALPVEGAAARALGAVPLKAEKSVNFSAGIVLTPAPNLNLTVDAYQIKIKDRILLSETLSGPTVISALEAAGIYGIAGGLIFSNAADTRTRGLDIVGTYRAGLGDMGLATISLSANFNKTIFTHIDPVPGPIAASGLALIGRTKQGDLTEGTPRDKFIANVLWEKDDFNMNLRATRFGKIVQRANATAFHTADFTACAVNVVSDVCFRDYVDEELKPKVIVDLEIGYKLTKGVKLSVGANNLLNTYPNKLKPVNQFVGFLYNAYAPYGISGGFYYGRLNLEF
ncbi:TonB-dependent receptor plug domain-containing protein [Sphingobium cupriresistens]|uniref:TonB-denpendent receptor n=1 Tax=Sphingobium cupriresistens LL01 TaxID=1420583 RepID=A0A0J7Y562_9SPHN|nr:TonB-dependent receptor [Sphingobium cupriresistens]KMS58513.1 TonB-denpendent receptor [Sphingobium cupriresistens LL01]